MVNNMYKNIQAVFAKHAPNLKFDKKLYKELEEYRIGWATKSNEYIDFLGTNLLGMHQIRFSTVDENKLFVDILGIDKLELEADLHSIKEINPNWKTSSNVTYLTIIYLWHGFLNSKNIGNDLTKAMQTLYYIFAYKVFGSLLSHYFKFNRNPAIAKATYERLSNRYIIKKVGSWQELFEYRAMDVTPPKGLHVNALKKLKTDDAILIANDLQGRLRDMLKSIYGVMVDVIESGDTGINTTSTTTTDVDGEGMSKDIVDRPDKYIVYLYNIYKKPNDFINNDALILIESIVKNVDIDLLKKSLLYISEKYDAKQGSKDDIFSMIILNNISYLNTKKYSNDYLKDIVDILNTIKSYWSSSRVTSNDIGIVKKSINEIVKKSINKKTKWVVATTVISVILYIFLRSLIRK